MTSPDASRQSMTHPGRRAFTMLEVIAAAAVTVMALGAITPLFLRQVRLLAETRRERLGLEELANQAERLAAVPAGEIDRHIAGVAVSEELRDLLPGAVLTAERAGPSPLGQRILLSLAWESPGRRQRPLSLVTFLPSLADREAAR